MISSLDAHGMHRRTAKNVCVCYAEKKMASSDFKSSPSGVVALYVVGAGVSTENNALLSKRCTCRDGLRVRGLGRGVACVYTPKQAQGRRVCPLSNLYEE